MKKIYLICNVILCLSLNACKTNSTPLNPIPDSSGNFMKGFDASMVSRIVESNGKNPYKNSSGESEDIFKILKDCGINWIRLRLWHSPDISTPGNNTIERTLEMAKKIKANGLNFLLDIHYSDTWADPAKQSRPEAWDDDTTIEELSRHVSNYTEEILTKLQDCKPDMIQIGNEINNGMLITKSNANSLEEYASPNCSSWYSKESAQNLGKILQTASSTIRKFDKNIRIMIHLSSKENDDLNWWFEKFHSKNNNSSSRIIDSDLDFDCIGLSYYPYYTHGSLDQLKNTIENLKNNYKKDVLIAETAWAWTDNWKDNQGNLFGNSQKIQGYENLKEYADGLEKEIISENGKTGLKASVKNQKSILQLIINEAKKSGAIGLFYWGGEWICTDGTESNWENQTLFDFDGKLLESVAAFDEI